MAKVLVLYGVSDRDPDERVCQFFPDTKVGRGWLDEFRDALPGRYDILVVSGVDYDKVKVV